ncbi:MAG: hypothetical protein AAB884_00595 [Patescibacteria group bacterium]
MDVLFILSSLAYVLAGLRNISKGHYGALYILNQYKRSADEGLVWWPRLIGEVEEWSRAPVPFQSVVRVYTKEAGGDKSSSWAVELTIDGTYQPDLRFMDNYRLWGLGVIDTDLPAQIGSILQDVASKHSMADFKDKHAGIVLLINSLLRLGNRTVPHLNALRFQDNGEPYYVLPNGTNFENTVPSERVLEFYEANVSRIRTKILDLEDKDDEDYSFTERRYGCDFSEIHVSAPVMTLDAERALAAWAVAAKHREAAIAKAQTARDIRKDLLPGLSDQAVVDQVDHWAGTAPKRIISAQGIKDFAVWESEPGGEGGGSVRPSKGGKSGR